MLSTLAGWAYGFDSPFKAEVYFVSTRPITDLKWGTPSPVLLRDPDFGPVRVRAFGTYTLRALDPRRLLEQLVGTDSSFESDEIGELLRAIIATAFADLVAKSEIALLDLSKNYQSLSEQLRELARTRIDDEYGLEIPQLYIVNVSVPAEVEQALDARTSMNVIGDLAAYQAYQLGAGRCRSPRRIRPAASRAPASASAWAWRSRRPLLGGAGTRCAAGAAAPARRRLVDRGGRPVPGPVHAGAARALGAPAPRHARVDGGHARLAARARRRGAGRGPAAAAALTPPGHV